MSDHQNMDVMLDSDPRDNYEVQEKNSENEVGLRSNRQDQGLNHHDQEFRFYTSFNLVKIVV